MADIAGEVDLEIARLLRAAKDTDSVEDKLKLYEEGLRVARAGRARLGQALDGSAAAARLHLEGVECELEAEKWRALGNRLESMEDARRDFGEAGKLCSEGAGLYERSADALRLEDDAAGFGAELARAHRARYREHLYRGRVLGLMGDRAGVLDEYVRMQESIDLAVELAEKGLMMCEDEARREEYRDLLEAQRWCAARVKEAKRRAGSARDRPQESTEH